MHAVFIDIQNFHLYTFIDLDIRMHIPNKALTDFRNMNQSVVHAVQINKCAVGLDSGNDTFHDLSNHIMHPLTSFHHAYYIISFLILCYNNMAESVKG